MCPRSWSVGPLVLNQVLISLEEEEEVKKEKKELVVVGRRWTVFMVPTRLWDELSIDF